MKEKSTKKQVKFAKYLKLLPGLCLAVQSISVQAQTFDWAKSMGATTTDYSNRVTVDGNGNTYITGYFSAQPVNFNPTGSGGTLTSKGLEDAFVAKYDPSGTYLWAKSMGGRSSDYGYDVAVDDNGNVYVTGYSKSDTINFNPGGIGGMLTNAGGGADAFLVKYDSSGNYLWAKSMGGGSVDYGYGVDMDGSGNVYVTGAFSTIADFNPGGSGGTLISAGGGAGGSVADVFLAKYDTDGNFQWAKSMGGSSVDYGYDIVVGDGNVYITGYFQAIADFNLGGSGGTLTSAGQEDGFIAKYDTGGNYLWAKSMGGSSTEYGYGVAIDGDGNVCITGFFASPTANFNPGGSGGTLTSVGSYDAFLAKYDAGGNYLWAKNVGGSSSVEFGMGVATDGRGNVYVAGYTNSATINFNPGGSGGSLTTAGRYDAYLVKYNADGNYLWAKTMGGSLDDFGQATAVDGSGSVYMTGGFASATAEFNPGGSGGTLTNLGNRDIYLVKYSCSDTSSSYLTVSTCEASYSLNDSIYTANGVYIQVFSSVLGCDSTITLDLSFYQLNPVINVDSFTLGVTTTYITYQWLKNGIAIPGATDSLYKVTENADYQVVVTNEDGCSDTSDVYPVTNYPKDGDVHISDNVLGNQIGVYPNPAYDIVYIQSPVKVNVQITDMVGKVINEWINTSSVSISALPQGVYLLNIIDKNGVLLKVEKLVKAE